MKLRKDQLDALNRQQEIDYQVRLTDFLREQFPDAAQEPLNRLRAEVGAQIVRARSYGLFTEQEIANYVLSAWLLGQDFDQEFPAAREVLMAPISGNMKSVFLEKWTEELFKTLEEGK
jgi:hypothetical protein